MCSDCTFFDKLIKDLPEENVGKLMIDGKPNLNINLNRYKFIVHYSLNKKNKSIYIDYAFIQIF